MNPLNQGFQLEGLRIEPETGMVSGPGGREKLDPKVMDVLLLMAQRAGEVVHREDLLSTLWPNVVVSDDALTRCFYELRRQLSHAGGDERYRTFIETVPKRGYRLTAAVTPAPSPRRLRGGWIALGAAAALLAVGIAFLVWRGVSETRSAQEGPHAIAVLPFLDMSAGKDQGYFSEGVTEEILNRLTQAENLRVISRTSSFALRKETLDVPTIAKRLDVDYVLEGSVRKSGARVRITAQLIDASTNSHVWSQTYDRATRRSLRRAGRDRRLGRRSHAGDARRDFSARGGHPELSGPRQGVKTRLPVVLRDSRSRCACAASASG